MILLDGRVHIYQGDVIERLREIPDEFVHCVVTSPPYWGLRDYNVAGQLGLEPTLGEHLAAMVDVFREVRRVLRKDGVCWINYGDCYATAPNGRSAADTKAAGNDDRTFRDKPFSTVGPINGPGGKRITAGVDRSDVDVGGWGASDDSVRWRGGGLLKAKDLCMVPQRLAIALQEDGWWVRSILPWLKRNAMPESIKDRPANAVEYVIMLTRSERYAYDGEAVKVGVAESQIGRERADAIGGTSWRERGQHSAGGVYGEKKRRASETSPRHNGHINHTGIEDTPRGSRNFRNTDLFFSSLAEPWGLISDEDGTPLAIDVPPAAFSEAHFATFPPGLIEPLIKAGCPKDGVVLDPFGGSGTTAMVAARLGRRAILIELSAEYVAIASARITEDWMGSEERARSRAKRKGEGAAGPLFE